MKSGWQDSVMNACRKHEYIDPRTHHLTSEKEYTKWDLAGIRASNLVFAYMDTTNPSGYGMCLEVGYARAIGRTVWYICEDASERQKYFGMVRACADRVFDSLHDAIKSLKGIS
jgi:nucleoside 2-deoxyribosyltransferase